MCIQCVILKIKNNINKHLGWLLFALVLTNIVLHLTLKCVALHINGLLLCLWKFSFDLSLTLLPLTRPFSLLTLPACRIIETNKTWYLTCLVCYIDVKDCISHRDNIGKTLYRCSC